LGTILIEDVYRPIPQLRGYWLRRRGGTPPVDRSSLLWSTKLTKLRGLSPRANATCRRSLVPTFADRRCHVVSMTDPYGRILGFLDKSCYFFFQ
jgi:hypothetical protein